MKRKTLAPLIAVIFIGLVAFLFLKTADNGAFEYAETEKAVRSINQRNTDLDSAVLTVRLGLIDDYDELTRCEISLEQLVNGDNQLDSQSSADSNLTIRPLIEEKVALVTDFKAAHSIIRNAVAGFRHHSSKAVADGRAPSEVAIEIARLETFGSRFVVSGRVDDRSNFEAAINNLKIKTNSVLGDQDLLKTIGLILKHARSLVERRIQLDETIASLVSVPVRQKTHEMIDTASSQHTSLSNAAMRYRFFLLLTITTLVGFCIFQYFVLYKQRSELFDANCHLESRVAIRTAELASTNLELEAAISEAEKLALVARYTDNAVLITNEDAIIEWVNVGFTRTTGYEPDEAIGKRTSDLLYGPNTEVEKIEFIQKAIDSKVGFDIETVHYRKNGEPYWVGKEVRPIKDRNGKVFRFITIESDITERVNGEIERKKLNDQLVDASRTAGMAEVATGVLHNVGNILNSVNVSTNLIRDQFQKSALEKLEKISSLISTHENDFGDFIKSDTRGQKIPAYIVRVTEALKQERDMVNSEFQDLMDNVEHIKEVVSVQQSFATTSGCIQELLPQDLINDSITANKGSLENHKISISLEIGKPMPKLQSDKHKIMQVLINLIKNAKDALVENRSKNPEIKVQVESIGESIVFRIVDNGVGIPANIIDKIFNHGFTTKRTGHGFGLHSSANAAAELGGDLAAFSDGAGTGATFQLTIPACRKSTSNGVDRVLIS